VGSPLPFFVFAKLQFVYEHLPSCDILDVEHRQSKMTELSAKLKSLGVQVGAKNLPPPKPKHANAIEKVLPGRIHPTPLGETFIVEQTFTSDYRHGNAALALNASLQTIAEWANEPRLAQCDPHHHFC